MNKTSLVRILNNDLVLIMSKSNEGKTMLICNLIRDYKSYFTGNIKVFGLDKSIVCKLGVSPFSSLLELEQIKNSIVFIDECGILMDLDNRQKKKQIEGILRKVNHNGNKLILGGLPMDFKRFLCSKAKVFMFKSLLLSDLINGSMAKEVIKQYELEEKGEFSLDFPIDEVLCFDGEFWSEKITYYKEFDTKLSNDDLFSSKNKKKV